MSCPHRERVLEALHAGESAEPDCLECLRALAEEERFVSLVERGLAGVRPPVPLAPLILERLEAEDRRRRRVRRAVWGSAAALLLVSLAGGAVLGLRRPRSLDGRPAGKGAPPPAEGAGPAATATADPLPPGLLVPSPGMFAVPVVPPSPAESLPEGDRREAEPGPDPAGGRIFWIPVRGGLAKAIRVRGRLEGEILRSVEISDPSHSGLAEISAVDRRLMVAGPDSVLRFRYRLDRAAPAFVRLWNETRGQEVRIPLKEAPPGVWADAALKLAGPAGRPGDVFSGIAWLVGRPGSGAEIQIRELRIPSGPPGR